MRTFLGALAASLVLAAPASADLDIQIFSPPPAQGASNGSSDHTAFSQDDRNVRIVAFDSAATNLVDGDRNGHRDVFALLKARGAGKMGGHMLLVSGPRANGDSSKPSVDGTGDVVPHCIAFESTATNLVAGARSHLSSIYLRDLPARRTSLVSAGARSATDASIDGNCRTVAYVAGGWVVLRDLRSRKLVRIARGENPDQQTDGGGVAYDDGHQVYLQRIHYSRAGVPRRGGRPILVSDTPRGAQGNGVSTNPAVDDHGDHVAFQSTATDMCPVYDCREAPYDNGPVTDVFRRTISEHGVRTREMIAVGMSWPHVGPSVNPSISRAGQAVAFEQTVGDETFAYQVPVVYRWYLRSDGHGRARPVSGEPQWHSPSYEFNGPSVNASISSRGNYVAFTSFGAGVFGEVNGPSISDVFMRFIGPSYEGLPTY